MTPVHSEGVKSRIIFQPRRQHGRVSGKHHLTWQKQQNYFEIRPNQAVLIISSYQQNNAKSMLKRTSNSLVVGIEVYYEDSSVHWNINVTSLFNFAIL